MSEFQLAKAYVEVAQKGSFRPIFAQWKTEYDHLSKALDTGVYKKLSGLGLKMAKDMDAAKLRARGVDLGVKKQDFEKDLSSGGFARRIQDTKKLSDEEAKLGKRISYAKSVAEIGLFRASMKKAKEDVADFRQKYEGEIAAANKIGKVFLVGAAAVTAFTAAASPVLLDTFTTSVKWLSAAIGTAFVPYVATAVGWIQQLARWIQALDPVTKSVAAGFVLFGVATAGVVFIVAKVIILAAELKAAWIALGLSQIFVSTTTAASIPITAAAATETAALTVAVNGLSLAYVRMAIAAVAAWAAINPGKAAAIAVGVGFAAGATAGLINKAMKNGSNSGTLFSADRAPQMMQISEAWRQAQLAGVQGGTPEKELLRLQNEANELARQTAANTATIANKVQTPTK